MNLEERVSERRKRRERFVYRGTKKQRFERWIYNKEDKTFCTRTLSGWFKVGCYHILFLAIVSALFAFFFWYDVKGTKIAEPMKNKLTLSPHPNPGVTFIGSNVDKYKDSIIWYTVSDTSSWIDRKPDKYVKMMRRFLKKQEDACSGKDCIFKNESFGPCSKPDFGYSDKKPCIFLKLSRLVNWKPKALSRIGDLPEAMKKRVSTSRRCVWVNCEPCTAFDKDNIGSFSYYPEAAFHEDYFPSKTDEHPAIALQLTNIKPGFVLSLQCELFADNIFKAPSKISKVFLFIGE